MNKVVAFHSYQLGGRGSEVSLYKYAKYNKEILGNKSIIVSTDSRPTPTLQMFKNDFDVFLYPDVWVNDGKNDSLRNSIEKICQKNSVEYFYAQKGGESDGILPKNVKKTLSHAMFRMDEPHGDVYAGISEYLSKKYNKNDFLDYIVELDVDSNENLRDILNIPKDAIVFGRHGGSDTFNLGFVYQSIINILNKRNDVYFLFLGTNVFYEHPNIKYINWTSSLENKSKFINTCDAMIHARYDGETFGLAVAEFSIRNKPVITWNPDIIPDHYDYAHISILKDKGIYYKNGNDLESIILSISKPDIEKSDWNAYRDYTPNKIIQKFENIFLN